MRFSILFFWVSLARAQGSNLNWANWLLPSTLSGRRVSPSQYFELVAYLCAKFRALNQIFNEPKSKENRSAILSQLQPPRFSKLLISLLAGLSPMIKFGVSLANVLNQPRR